MKDVVRYPSSVVREAPRDVSRFTFHASRIALLLACFAVPAPAQNPPQAQVQQLLQQSPELIRQRLQQSGLSAEEIRARLEQAGYSRTLLDQFLSGGPEVTGQAAVSEEMLRALDALVPQMAGAEGLERVPVTTGPQPAAGRAAPAAPAGLTLFGADVFRGRTTRFQPLLTGPVPPNYRVGPGDVMVLVITGDVEIVQELAVK